MSEFDNFCMMIRKKEEEKRRRRKKKKLDFHTLPSLYPIRSHNNRPIRRKHIRIFFVIGRRIGNFVEFGKVLDDFRGDAAVGGDRGNVLAGHDEKEGLLLLLLLLRLWEIVCGNKGLMCM